MQTQEYADILAANYNQWRAFEDAKRELLSEGYTFEIRSGHPFKPGLVEIYRNDYQIDSSLESLISHATGIATSRGHEIRGWQKSSKHNSAHGVCQICSAEVSINGKDISGSALVMPCC